MIPDALIGSQTIIYHITCLQAHLYYLLNGWIARGGLVEHLKQHILIISLTFVNLVTPKARAEHEQLFNKLASELLKILVNAFFAKTSADRCPCFAWRRGGYWYCMSMVENES